MTRVPLMLAFLATACSESIAPEDEGSAASPEDTGELVAQEVDGETTLTTVDATDYQAWQYYDLDRAELVDRTDGWDIALQRYLVALNGGVGGDAGLEAAMVGVVDFETWDEVPADGWATDRADADDDGVPERVFDDWYDYDGETHVLSTKGQVYVVRTTDGAHVKVHIDDYYSPAGSSGHMSFRFAVVSDD